MLPSRRGSPRSPPRSLAASLRWLLCGCGVVYMALLWHARPWTLSATGGHAMATSMRVTTPTTADPIETTTTTTPPRATPPTSIVPTTTPATRPAVPIETTPITPRATPRASIVPTTQAAVDLAWLRGLVLTPPSAEPTVPPPLTEIPLSLEAHSARMEQLETMRRRLQASVAAIQTRLAEVRATRLVHATVLAEADARLVRPLPRGYTGRLECLGWRATSDCDPRGPRDPAGDKPCAHRVPAKTAGYCEVRDAATHERFRVMETACDSLRWDAHLSCADAPQFATFAAQADTALRPQSPPRAPGHGETPTRGVVLVVYPKMLPSAYATVRTLRRLGCTLEVELWYAPSELRDADRHAIVRRLVSEYGPTTLRAIDDARVHGFTTKIHAIRHSAFDHVLFLDADNVPVQDPTFLFELPEFTRTGALFWPDFWHPDHTIFALHKRSLVWQYLDLPFVDMFEQESGQLVVDKTRSRAPLALLELYAHHKPNLLDKFKIVHGDKDLFRLAWLKANASFAMVEKPPAIAGNVIDGMFCGQTMAQFDPHGELLFLHRNAKKLQGRRVVAPKTLIPGVAVIGATTTPLVDEETQVDPEIWTHLLQLKPTSTRADYTVEIYKGSDKFPPGQWCYGKPSPAAPHFNTFRFADLPAVRDIESEIRAYAIEATDLVRDATPPAPAPATTEVAA